MRVTRLSALEAQFRTLPCPPIHELAGVWQVQFIGPRWLRATAPKAIAWGGLPDWQGKRFLSAQRAVNCLADGRERLPMTVSIAPSWLDGQPAVVCTYGDDAPWPWRRVRDEFRSLAPHHWLGMTLLDAPGLRRTGWPLTLVRAG